MTKHLPEGHAPPPGRTRKRPEPTRGDGQPRHPPHRDQLPKPAPSLAWSELARKAQFRVSAMARLQGTTRRTLLRRSQRDHGCSLADEPPPFSASASEGQGCPDTKRRAVFLPATVSGAQDANGNLTSDGSRTFEYDLAREIMRRGVKHTVRDVEVRWFSTVRTTISRAKENQLTNVCIATKWRSEFVYDTLMRRRVRKEYTWQGAAWVQTNEVRYVYDQLVVVQARWYNPQVSLSTPQKLITYTRGNDLSRDLQEAGGIGGLLARSDSSLMQSDPASAHVIYATDANGNVTALVNNNYAVVARYQYDPYGNINCMSEPMAEANLYRFSSKEYHPNSGLVYYLYRYYEPNLQRWGNRDPIGETGGLNLLRFVRGNPTSWIDALGLCEPKPGDAPFLLNFFLWLFGKGAFSGTVGGGATWSPAFVHLTDEAGLAGINQSGCIVGRHGIFAVPTFVAAESTGWKIARTGLPPAKTTQFLPIPGGSQCLFQKPLPIGPYSAWKFFGGVHYAPPGAISTTSGAFTPGWSLMGPKTLIYGPDALFYGGAAATGGLCAYGGGSP